MAGRLSTEIQGAQRSIFLQGEDAVSVLQSVYPAELAWSLVPEDIEDCKIVMEVPFALEALTIMVDHLHAMRKSGEAARRAHAYDALQATALRLGAQIHDTWEPPFEIPEITPIGGNAENQDSQYIPTQSTSAEAEVAGQPQADMALTVAL